MRGVWLVEVRPETVPIECLAVTAVTAPARNRPPFSTYVWLRRPPPAQPRPAQETSPAAAAGAACAATRDTRARAGSCRTRRAPLSPAAAASREHDRRPATAHIDAKRTRSLRQATAPRPSPPAAPPKRQHAVLPLQHGHQPDFVDEFFSPGALRDGIAEALKIGWPVLLNHDYSKPVGRVIAATVDAKGRLIDAEIHPAEPGTYAAQFLRLVKAGLINAWSIGGHWTRERVGDLQRITKARILEASLCVQGINDRARFEVVAGGKMLATSLGPDDPSGVKYDVALARLRLAGLALDAVLAGR